MNQLKRPNFDSAFFCETRSDWSLSIPFRYASGIIPLALRASFHSLSASVIKNKMDFNQIQYIIIHIQTIIVCVLVNIILFQRKGGRNELFTSSDLFGYRLHRSLDNKKKV